MKAIIMAGGEGTRLRPLTCDRPKPMVTMFDRPVMEYIIALLRETGIVEIGVTLQYLPQFIMDYFGDGKDFGVRLRYFIEDEPLGTAGSVKGAESFLDDDFVVISGDSISDMDLTKAISFHYSKKALATLLLHRVEEPLSYGVVVTDADGRIERFIEKPTWPYVVGSQINTGIYVCSREILEEIPENSFYDFSQNLFTRLLSEQRPLYGCEPGGYWCDIGDIEAYLNCHFDILSGKVKIPFSIPVITERTGDIFPPSYISQGAIIEPGALIGPFSAIQQGAVVKKGARVARSVVYPDAVVGKDCEVKGALIGPGARLGDRASCFEGCVIGSGTMVGAGAALCSGAKIWPLKQIEEETLVSEDIIWGEGAQRPVPCGGKMSGEFNTEITGQMAVKLAGAAAVMCKGGDFAAGCSFGVGAAALKEGALSGAALAGALVVDCGVVSKEAFSHCLWKTGTYCGIYVSLDGDRAELQVLSKDGGSLSPAVERQLCAVFQRGEIKYPKAGGVSPIKRCKNVERVHLSYILRQCGRGERAVAAGFFPDESVLSRELSALMEAFGVHSPSFGQTGAQGKAMITLKDGNIWVIDEKGGKLSGERLFLLFCRLYHRKYPQNPIFLSSWAAFAARRDDSLKGAQIVTSDTEAALHSKVHLSDSVFCMGMLLSFLSEGGGISRELSTMEEIFVSRREVYCSRGNKGMVIERLLREQGAKVPGCGGIEIEWDKEEIFITPHPERPVCHVCAAGFKEEISAELCDRFEEKIIKMQEK